MYEELKQEIRDVVKPNFRQQINGQNLQDVLIDMVNNYPAVSGSEELNELIAKSGSWDNAADWVTNNSGSLVTSESLAPVVEGLEDEIAEIGDTYATTASVTTLSASLDERINNIITGSGVDLSGYATTASVNAATESVKEWVEDKHYLTEHQDISGLATTASVNSLSESVANDFANLDIPDISGLATTASVNSLSSSLHQDIQNVEGNLSEYATTASVNSLSESVNIISASFDQRITALPTSSRDDTLRSFLFDSQSVNITAVECSTTNLYSSINTDSTLGITAYPDPGRTVSVTVTNTDTQASHSVIIPDVLGNYNVHCNGATSGSLVIPPSEIGDLVITEMGGDLYIRTSLILSEEGGTGADLELRNYLFGSSSQAISSIDPTVSNILCTIGENVSLSLSSNLGEGRTIDIIVANTSSVSASVSIPNTLLNQTNYIDGFNEASSLVLDPQERGEICITRLGNIYYTRTSIIDGYATTTSLNQLSESVAADISGLATTASVNTLSSSFDQRINDISGSGGGGDYLPLAGGTLTGNLQVNASVGVGAAAGGSNCLVVGSSGTEANSAHNSVVVGEDCHASVWNAFAAGRENYVETNGAFGSVTGFRNRVNAMAAYAGGCRSTGSGEFATAIGFGAAANSKGQVVLGSYNELDPTGNRTSTGSYAVIFGIGKSSTWNQDDPGNITRQNGLAIKWNGDIDINYSGSVVALQAKIAELEARLAALESA